MASDPGSLELIGEQLNRVQADIRDLKGRVLLVENDQADMRRDLARLDTRVEVLAERVEDRFDQVDQRFVELFRMLNQNFASVRQDIAALKQR